MTDESSAEVPINLMMDSGAYSAWRTGNPIDLVEYCDWLEEHQHRIGPYAALDEIDPDDPVNAARRSYENLEYMLGRGLCPIPVFHIREPFEWLERILATKVPYVGLSGTSLIGDQRGIFDWYSQAWGYMTTPEGLPTVYVHAFGEATPQALTAFPWKSADSASWLYGAMRTSTMTLPSGVKVAQRRDAKQTAGVLNHGTMPELDRVEFERQAAALGLRPEALNEDPLTALQARALITLSHYASREAKVRALQPIKHRPTGFFSTGVSRLGALPDFDFNMFLALGAGPNTFAAPAMSPHRNYLFSYFYLRTQKAMQRHLLDYCDRPRVVCSTTPPYVKHWNLLKGAMR